MTESIRTGRYGEGIVFRRGGVDLEVVCRFQERERSEFLKFRGGRADASLYEIPYEDREALPRLLAQISSFQGKYQLGPRQNRILDKAVKQINSTVVACQGWPVDF